MDPDQAAVRRVLAGEVSAFRELVERHERALFVYLGNLARHPQDAEDLAQESFLTAYEQLARFDPARGAFSTWLFTLARRRALNHLAAARRRPTRPPRCRAYSAGTGETSQPSSLTTKEATCTPSKSAITS